MKATCLSGIATIIIIIIVSSMINPSYAKEDPQFLKELSNTAEVAILTRYEVKKGSEKKFSTAIRKYATRANANESNIMAEAYYEEGNPSVLWIIERWSDQNAIAQFRKGTEFNLIKALSNDKLVQSTKEIYVKDLEPISKNEWRRSANKGDKPITIMLFVDSKPGTEEIFKATYHTAMPLFRSEPGVINYQLSQLSDDSTQFVTYEKFRNEDAFQYHLKFPPIQPVIDYLNTSIKQQPFQAGLHRLIEFTPAKK